MIREIGALGEIPDEHLTGSSGTLRKWLWEHTHTQINRVGGDRKKAIIRLNPALAKAQEH